MKGQHNDDFQITIKLTTLGGLAALHGEVVAKTGRKTIAEFKFPIPYDTRVGELKNRHEAEIMFTRVIKRLQDAVGIPPEHTVF